MIERAPTCMVYTENNFNRVWLHNSYGDVFFDRYFVERILRNCYCQVFGNNNPDKSNESIQVTLLRSPKLNKSGAVKIIRTKSSPFSINIYDVGGFLIHDEFNYFDFTRLLLHEFVHIRQEKEGRYQDVVIDEKNLSKTRIRWRNDHNSDFVDYGSYEELSKMPREEYYNLPWEVEALDVDKNASFILDISKNYGLI